MSLELALKDLAEAEICFQDFFEKFLKPYLKQNSLAIILVSGCREKSVWKAADLKRVHQSAERG